MTQETWLLGGAAFSGLIIGHSLDVLAANFRRWWRGNPVITTHFSPKGGCTAVIVEEMNAARSEILMQAYSFTCPDIAQALIAAAGRGVRVRVVLDRSNEAESHTELGDLKVHGIDVKIDASHAIAHNKVVVIDGRTVLTGSFNFTRQAEHENAENLIVLRNHHDQATLYRANFDAHADHSHLPGEATLQATPPSAHYGHYHKAA